MANTYFEMLQAVENYYGSGSDQWLTMANWTGYQSAEVANILKQTPGIDVYTNAAGEILSYSVDGAASSMTTAQAAAATAANAINSNALTEAAVQEAVTIPANVTAGATAGTVEITSGATKLAAGGGRAATVLGHIGTAIVGAGIGMKLGVWLDGAFYNIGSNFWDIPEEYNPETWADYKITNWLYDYSGYDDFIAHFDEDGQAYIDENVFAMYAQYMAANGFFSAAAEDAYYCTNDDLDPTIFNFPSYINYRYNYYKNFAHFSWGNQLRTYTAADNEEDVYFFFYSTNQDGSRYYTCYAISRGTFSVPNEAFSDLNTRQDPNGVTYYYRFQYNSAPSGTRLMGCNYNYCPGEINTADFWGHDIPILLFYGSNVAFNRPVGVNPYDTMPSGITPEMSIPDIINLLKQQYPELWDNGIKQGTLNDDGTITDRIYIPIAIPTGGTDTQPTTDPDHPGAVDPDNEPQTKTAEKIIKKTPEPKPTNPDPGDTGTGETPVVPTPTGSADALYKIYNPTNAQIQSFGAWLWSSNFVDQLLKVFNDPMQAIISLHKIYATPHRGGTANIKVGYLDSGVPSDYVDQQYIDVDCGTVTLPEKWGSVLDYEPFVEVRLYLPFIGIVSLSTADVIRAAIGVKYRIDVITGTLVATVNVKRDSGAGGVIYQYTGSCCEAYPLSSGSYMGILTGVMGIAAGVVGTIATGGLAAPALLGGAAALSTMHTKIEHSNGFSGNAGAMACKKPYLIISRQQSAISNGISGQGGYPANTYVKLDQCTGFTKVKYCHLTGIGSATDTELEEIESLLKEGVII